MGIIYGTCGHEVGADEEACWLVEGGREGEELSWVVFCPECKERFRENIKLGEEKAREWGLNEGG